MTSPQIMSVSLILMIHAFAIIGTISQSLSLPLPPYSGPAPAPAPFSPAGSPEPASTPSYSHGYDPPAASPSPSQVPPGAIKAAYYQSFKDDFPPSSIDTSYFTHIYYAFLQLDPTTFQLNITPTDLQKLPDFVNSLKNTPVKALLSIGGAGNDPKIFSRMARTKRTRAIFINSTIQVAREYGFDGLDLDWEYPANKRDMFKLALLYREWRQALEIDAAKPRLLLTSAVYYSSKFIGFGEPRGYPGPAMNLYLDFVGPMCYDYYGSWSNFTGPSAALYDPNSNLSASYGLRTWIEAGVPASKLVMGMPLYGRTWTLKDPSNNGFGAPAVGVGPEDRDDDPGVLSYSKIVEFNKWNNAQVNYEGEIVAYYSYVGTSWIGYDDVLSVDLKIQFAKELGLGGYFFWALGQDKDWTISRLASNAWGR